LGVGDLFFSETGASLEGSLLSEVALGFPSE